MKGKLFGVGVGPGDPELLTLKAIRVLQSSDVVVVPEGGKESLAYRVVKPYLRGEILFLPFAMAEKGVSEERLAEGIAQVGTFLEEGKQVAFVTLGDPLLYSTFMVLWRFFPEVEVEIIPGVSSFQAAAARLKLPLVQGQERLAVLSGTDWPAELLRYFESVVVFKVAKGYEAVWETLKQEGFVGGLVNRLGWQEEVVVEDLEQFRGGKLDYFSLLVARRVKP